MKKLIDPVSCGCKCNPGYQGPRCQYAVDPCGAEDTPFCSNVDCFNATEFDFYSCPRKCLCCGNKKCYNLGQLVQNGDDLCECKCFSDKYDPADNCKSLVSSDCADDTETLCYGQFGGPTNCGFDFVKAKCPKMCRVC